MRWLIATFLLTSLTFCSLRYAIGITDQDPDTFWEWMPGYQSRELEHLGPDFRIKAKSIIETLERENFKVAIVSTWRSPLRHYVIQIYSSLRNWVGLGPATSLSTVLSCHTQ